MNINTNTTTPTIFIEASTLLSALVRADICTHKDATMDGLNCVRFEVQANDRHLLELTALDGHICIKELIVYTDAKNIEDITTFYVPKNDVKNIITMCKSKKSITVEIHITQENIMFYFTGSGLAITCKNEQKEFPNVSQFIERQKEQHDANNIAQDIKILPKTFEMLAKIFKGMDAYPLHLPNRNNGICAIKSDRIEVYFMPCN